jgi:hypothetical protein
MGDSYEFFAKFIYFMARHFTLNPQLILDMDLDLAVAMQKLAIEEIEEQKKKMKKK